MQLGLTSGLLIKVYTISEIPSVAISSEITITLQCDRFIFLLIYPFARLIAYSREGQSIVSITVSGESDEPPEGLFEEAVLDGTAI